MLDNSHKHVSCINCKTRSESLFKGFASCDLEHLDETKSCNFYKKNQGLFLDGALPRGVFCINKGKVKVYSLGDEGKEQIIHIAKEGEIIGYRAMLTGEPYKLSATTLEESNICFIHREEFLNMLDHNVSLRNGLLKELSQEVTLRADFITNLSQKTVRERLAVSLMILNDIYQDEAINLSREDLANFVGTATETLIRLLRELKDDGVIEIDKRKIAIVNMEALRKVAGNHR